MIENVDLRLSHATLNVTQWNELKSPRMMHVVWKGSLFIPE